MKRFLQHRSRRFGYDGWALQVRGSTHPMDWTASTTRKEAREILREMKTGDFAWTRSVDIVKVRINVEVVDG